MSNKIREREGKKALLTGIPGAMLLRHGRDPLVGQKTLYHGTSKKAWDSIRKVGLQTTKGGDNIGLAKTLGKLAEPSVNHSKGHVYISGTKSFARGAATAIQHTHRQKPKILTLKLPFNRYKTFEIDPEMAILRKFNKDKLKLNLPDWAYRHQASRTPVDIEPKYIKGTKAWRRGYASRAGEIARNLPGYIRSNPRRFARGALATAAGAYLLTKAGKSLSKMSKNRKKK